MSDTRTEQDPKPTTTHPVKALGGYLLGGVLGLGLLMGVGRLLHRAPDGPVQELPHLALLAEFGPLDDPAAREALVALHRDLVELGLIVTGPLNYAILVPQEPGTLPKLRQLDRLTEEEFARARPYFQAGGWLVPRVYSEDLEQALFRVGPPAGKPFPSGTAQKVEQLISQYSQHGTLRAYSRALRLEREEDRSAINLAFGVQTANVLMTPSKEGKTLSDPEVLNALHVGLRELKSVQVRSLTTMGNWLVYAESVRRGRSLPPEQQLTGMPVAELLDLAKEGRVPSLLSPDGARGVIEVATDAEGEANLELCYWVAANAPKGAGVRYAVNRGR